MEEIQQHKKLHIAMYPWFAFGHFIPFLNLANKLAAKGHKISFFLPKKVSSKLAFRNHYPNHITFIPITVPPVDGLPIGVESMADTSNFPLLISAMDLTEPVIDSLLSELKPDIVLFDFTHWLPRIARGYRIKSVSFYIVHISLPSFNSPSARSNSESDFGRAPPGFPCPEYRLKGHELKKAADRSSYRCGIHGLSFREMLLKGVKEADAVCFKGCKEMDMHYGEYFEKHYGKPVVWAGPGLPEPQVSGLDEKMGKWLNGFEKGSVVYCALGGECVLEKEQFQELLLGLELTGLPFLAALKPPVGYDTMESATPEGFVERTKDKGAIHNWVQQELILKHPSVGCFVTHCGASSFTESMLSDCQLVLLPINVDHSLHARFMSMDLKVGLEVNRREDDGFFSKEDVCQAILKVCDKGSKLGVELRRNHAKWRELFLEEGFEENYINNLVESFQNLIK